MNAFLTQTCPEMDFSVGISKIWLRIWTHLFQDAVCANFQAKHTALIFSVQIFPKTDLGLEIQKTNEAIRINILEIPSVPVFRQSGQLWHFRPKFAPKLILVSEFQKSKFGFRISTSKIPCVWILKMDNFEFICLNLGKLSNYMGYFHSNNGGELGGEFPKFKARVLFTARPGIGGSQMVAVVVEKYRMKYLLKGWKF